MLRAAAQDSACRAEFAAYGLLYAALLPRQLAAELRGLPPAALREPAVQHALRVRCPCALPCQAWRASLWA